MAKILSKFGEQQPVMVNYAWGFNQSETGKYFERITTLFTVNVSGLSSGNTLMTSKLNPLMTPLARVTLLP